MRRYTEKYSHAPAFNLQQCIVSLHSFFSEENLISQSNFEGKCNATKYANSTYLWRRLQIFFVLYILYGLLCPKSVGSCVLVLTGVYLRLSWLSWVYVKQTKNTKNLNIEKEIFLLSHNHCVMQHLQSVISTQTLLWRIFLTFINCFWFTECRSLRGCQVTLHCIDGFTLLISSSDWIICPSTDSSTIRNL